MNPTSTSAPVDPEDDDSLYEMIASSSDDPTPETDSSSREKMSGDSRFDAHSPFSDSLPINPVSHNSCQRSRLSGISPATSSDNGTTGCPHPRPWKSYTNSRLNSDYLRRTAILQSTLSLGLPFSTEQDTIMSQNGDKGYQIEGNSSSATSYLKTSQSLHAENTNPQQMMLDQNKEKSYEADGASQQPACAACNHQRKRCRKECVFAPYFPYHKTQEFQLVRKHFGVSNLGKLIRKIPHSHRKKAAESFIWEADCRERNPVLGPQEDYLKVCEDLKQCRNDCEELRQRLHLISSNNNNTGMYSNYNVPLPLNPEQHNDMVVQYQQQFQQPKAFGLNGRFNQQQLEQQQKSNNYGYNHQYYNNAVLPELDFNKEEMQTSSNVRN